MSATRHDSSVTQRRQPRTVASPRARRAMRQRGVDPGSISGTGPNGRIVEADVLRAAHSRGPAEGARDVRSCFTLRAVADLTTLMSLQRQVAEQVQNLSGASLRLGDLVLRAMALALEGRPEANRIWRESQIVNLGGVSVGLEVSTPVGPILAVIGRADQLGLIQLVRHRADLEAGAQSGKYPVDGSRRAAMCLWDLSDQPVDEWTATVAPAVTSVLALGRAAPRPHVVGDQLVIRQTAWLSLSADERVIPPELAAALLGRIVELLERPFVLICDRPPWQP